MDKLIIWRLAFAALLFYSAPTISALPSENFICVGGYTTNMREEPTTSSQIVAKLTKYTPLVQLERQETWTKVKNGNFVGWVHNGLLDDDIRCVLSTKSYATHESYSSQNPHKFRNKVFTGEGFKILKTQMGMTQVKDKTGNVFWLENHILWPKNHLESLRL